MGIDLRPQLGKILHHVVGEAVVVIDHQHGHGYKILFLLVISVAISLRYPDSYSG
jgi:hypothetical protein